MNTTLHSIDKYNRFVILGVRLSESSFNGWFKTACELLALLYEVLKEETLKADYIQVDETTLLVIDNQAHRAKKEYLWVVRSVIDGATFFIIKTDHVPPK